MSSKDRTETDVDLPPPIIVYGVANIRPVQDLLHKIVEDQYSLKLLANDQVEIQLNDKDKVRLVTVNLKSNNMIFEISKKRREGTYKVVLRNMHPSVDTNTIVKELEVYGHRVVSITNVRNPITKEPMPLFHIELELRANNEDIYSLTKLSNMIVAFEPHNLRKTSLRCSKCQSYGHRDRSCDNVATGTTNSENDSSDSYATTSTPPAGTPTSSGETPVAYVQPIRSLGSKNNQPNPSTSSHEPNQSNQSDQPNQPDQPTATPSAPSAQEQLATLNRLRNLENMVNSTLSSLESTLLLTATLKQRLG